MLINFAEFNKQNVLNSEIAKNLSVKICHRIGSPCVDLLVSVLHMWYWFSTIGGGGK